MSEKNYITYGIGENTIELTKEQDELYANEEKLLIEELNDSNLTKLSIQFPSGWKVGSRAQDLFN